MFAGSTASDWLAIFRQNWIDFSYWTRAASMTEYSLTTSLFGRYDNKKFLTKIIGVQVKPPIFVLEWTTLSVNGGWSASKRQGRTTDGAEPGCC